MRIAPPAEAFSQSDMQITKQVPVLAVRDQAVGQDHRRPCARSEHPEPGVVAHTLSTVVFLIRSFVRVGPLQELSANVSVKPGN